jgi:hypothetical protein
MSDRGPNLEGTLADLPLPELLTLLTSTDKSGIIEVRGATEGMIVLDRGQITVAESDAGPTLRQAIINVGLVTPDDWEKADDAALRGTPLVETFLDMGVDEEQLRQVLYDQTVASVFEVLLPSEDLFGFFDGAVHPIGGRFRYPAEKVLADAGRRVEVWKAVAEAVPSTALVMQPTRVAPEPEVTLLAEQWQVLARLDGRATIADVIRTLGMSAFDVCCVLRDLLDAKLVEVTDDPR